MSRAAWVLAFVLSLSAGILALAWIDPPEDFQGRRHPEFSTMRQGGDASARHEPLLLPGWLLGCGIIGCFSAMVHFGALRGRGRQGLGRWLKVSTFLYLAIWTWLVWTYRANLGAEEPRLFLTLPPAAAIMIFVFWPVSMLFNLCFVLGFHRWVLTPEEETAFERLVESRKGRH